MGWIYFWYSHWMWNIENLNGFNKYCKTFTFSLNNLQIYNVFTYVECVMCWLQMVWIWRDWMFTNKWHFWINRTKNVCIYNFQVFKCFGVSIVQKCDMLYFAILVSHKNKTPLCMNQRRDETNFITQWRMVK